jgi:hypothetical protein
MGDLKLFALGTGSVTLTLAALIVLWFSSRLGRMENSGDVSMASTKTLLTAFGVTVALALGGLQSSVAQARAKSQNQGIARFPDRISHCLSRNQHQIARLKGL